MAAAKKQSEILDLEKVRARKKRTNRVHIKSLGADVVVRKLPAMMLEDTDEDTSLLVLTLVQGVDEPEMSEELVRSLDFDEANEIFEAVSDFNPGVLTEQKEDAARRRKAFPTRT